MTPTIEERIHRLRTGLAEMGYPDVVLVVEDGGSGPEVGIAAPFPPVAVCWMAWHVADREGCPCWACWRTQARDVMYECAVHGNCAHPEGPAKPPRELLVAP